MVKAMGASYLWKKRFEKTWKHSQYGSHQGKEAIKSNKAYLKTVVESK